MTVFSVVYAFWSNSLFCRVKGNNGSVVVRDIPETEFSESSEELLNNFLQICQKFLEAVKLSCT